MDLNIEGCPVQGSLNVFACIAPLKASTKVDIICNLATSNSKASIYYIYI